MNNKKWLKVAIQAANRGGKILKQGFYRNKSVSFKGFADPVTQYDKASEKAIVTYLQNKAPAFGILTEEELSHREKSETRWIIDPIDGTVNFIHSIPFVCVSIALEHKGEVIVGVIYNPVLNELFYASKGGGAWLNGKPIHVSDTNEAAHTMVVTGFPYEREGRLEELLKPLPPLIMDYRGFRRFGSAAVDLCYVACGRLDVFYEENLKAWDTAAGAVLVKEAGGLVTDYFDGPYDVMNHHILATNGPMHGAMLDILKDVCFK